MAKEADDTVKVDILVSNEAVDTFNAFILMAKDDEAASKDADVAFKASVVILNDSDEAFNAISSVFNDPV